MPNRILKESICYSEDIDQLKPFEEIVFYRLMVNCDDYGRIDARTTFLKSKLFVTKQGITNQNVEDAILKLASIGLVQLYTVNEKPYLLFPKWGFHQQIRTKKSKYPAPDENGYQMISNDIKCSYNPIQSEYESESEYEFNNNTLSAEPPNLPNPKPPKPDILALYSELCPNLPQARTLTDKRKVAINKLIKQIGLDDIKNAFAIFNQSDFCNGINDRGWKADFDFCIKPESVAKALEGKYDARAVIVTPAFQAYHKETVNERNKRLLDEFFGGGDIIDARGIERSTSESEIKGIPGNGDD